MRRKSLLLVLISLLVGCTSMDNWGMSPQQIAEVERNAAMSVTCDGASDCELKWARALDWVQRNSRWKLRVATEMVITTEGPLDTTDAAFEITKYPRGGGHYEIRFRAGCGNVFGCVPSLKQLQADFNVSVMGHAAQIQPPVVVAREEPELPKRDATDEAFKAAFARGIESGQKGPDVKAAIGREPDGQEWSLMPDGRRRESWTYRFPSETVTITFIDSVVTGVSVQKRP